MDDIVDQYPRHAEWIKTVIKDKEGKLVPVFFNGGTIEECIKQAQALYKKLLAPSP